VSSDVRYDERMKSKLDTDTTPTKKYRNFKDGLRTVLTVSKTELQKREKEYQDSRANLPKRGPKPSSASGHGSNDED
jgi:hypothetical protein